MSLRDALQIAIEALETDALEPVRIAIVDSGIDATHPDLAGRIEAAYVVHGNGDHVETRKNDANNDRFGHGTAVASIIARIAPNVRIVDVGVLDEKNAATGSGLLAGLNHSYETGARVLNLSLACHRRRKGALQDFAERAYFDDRVVVSSRRNFPPSDIGYPAALTSVIGVDRMRSRPTEGLLFKKKFPVEFAAPGDQIVVAAAGGGYTTMTGTSFATPAVAGLCCRLLGRFPSLTPFEVKAVLKATADQPRPLPATP